MRMEEMRKWCVAIMALIQVVSWVCATSRPISSSHVPLHPGIISTQAAEHNSRKPILKPNESTDVGEMEKRRIGSKPPTCEKKCYGCEPCEAIQVPTINSSPPHLSTHYTNYQPEGWRCHCAP